MSHRLRAVVLLGGAVRASDFGRSIGRSTLNLPVDAERDVLSCWRDNAAALARRLGVSSLPVRLLVDRDAAPPQPVRSDPAAPIQIEQDQASFRGTGGVLRDLSEAYQPSDLLLVANAGQVLLEPFDELAVELLRSEADVAFIGHDDGTPANLMLMACSALSRINAVGFIDFKEQVLPRLASAHTIRVVRRAQACGLPIRTREQYLTALRVHHRLEQGGGGSAGDPYAEDWFKTFGLVEPGAAVSATATIHDSVVLSGARVGADAVVVRCVVGAGAEVRGGEVAADQVLSGARARAGAR